MSSDLVLTVNANIDDVNFHYTLCIMAKLLQ